MKRYTLPQFKQHSLFTRIIAALITILVTAATIFVGAFFLAIFVGLAVVAALVIWVRVWWIRRKMAKAGYGSASAPGSTRTNQGYDSARGRVIEGDAEVKSSSQSSNKSGRP